MATNAKSSDRDQLQKLLAEEQASRRSRCGWCSSATARSTARRRSSICADADLAADELAEWLAPIKRPLAVINCASASAPFLNRLAGENRVVITATKSGDEQNFARFGQYISAAIADRGADLDKDGQVSLLEAYLTACRKWMSSTSRKRAGDRACAAGRQRRRPGHAGRVVPRRAGDAAGQRGRVARRHAGPSVSPGRQRPRETAAGRSSASAATSWNWQSPSCAKKKRKLNEDDYYDRLEKLMLELAQLYEPTSE